MENRKICIGLVGEKGSGKETFVKITRAFLPEKKIIHLRFGDIIADLCNILNLPLTRENMQRLPVVINQCYGPNTITNAMKARLEKTETDILILDGIRLPSDAKMLKSLENSFLVYITAGAETRYHRTKLRKEKAGEGLATFEEFLQQDQAEIEKQIPAIGKVADWEIKNDWSLENFRIKIQDLLCLIKNP